MLRGGLFAFHPHNAEKYKVVYEAATSEKARQEAGQATYSVKEMPLVEGEDHEEVLEKAPMGQLHVTLGCGNKLWRSMHKACS